MFDSHDFLNTFIDNHSIELVSIIGSGSYGVVYLGRYVYTNRYYAVKCVMNSPTSENEINMHSVLSGHSNILTLEKVVKERNFCFIIMEYATHGDLFSSVTQPSLSRDIIGKSKVVRHLFLQILDAVQHCHHHLIAHRDLKPENILLLSNHRVKLADFGLATTQLVSNEFNCGSSFYFSPECQGIELNNNNTSNDDKHCSNKKVLYDTRANDVWSLGIILINLVSGRNPWKQANLEDSAFAAYVKQPRRFFRTTLPGISKSLDRILIRIFCLDPAKRVTLPELRNMVLGCRSFTSSSAMIAYTIDNTEDDKPITPQPSQEIRCSWSFESAVMAYTGDYIDDIELSLDLTREVYKQQQRQQRIIGKSCSNTSSFITDDDPPTPRNETPFKFQYSATKEKQQSSYFCHYEQLQHSTTKECTTSTYD